MTGRQRLNAILARQPADRLSWTALVDENTLGQLPGPLRDMAGAEFYRHIGCDIFQLNGWGTPHAFRSPELRWPAGLQETRRQEGDVQVRALTMGDRVLTSAEKRSHPIEYLVKTRADLHLYREMWEGAHFVEHDDAAAHAALNALVGDDGLVVRFWGPSAIPRLLQNDVGIAGFYYLLQDYPDDMAALISRLHARELAAFEMLARGPCEVVTLVENTSTHYISRELYRKYNGPQVRDFVRIVHAEGRIALVHMCGHLRDLLADIRLTGLDGVHALTPPPTGNTPWEAALEVLGEDTILIGALDPSIFITGPVEGIPAALDALYTPRLRRSHFVLCLFADGIPVPLERFEAVSRWMAKNSR